MKKVNLCFLLLSIVLLHSCSTIRVSNDYDKEVNFIQFKTYAFHKNGIDKVEISDFDKKRILSAIDNELTSKGLVKSENPELLINFFTTSKEKVNVNQFNGGWGYGWGFSPWGMGIQTSISSYTEGTLYIDIINSTQKELIWQGVGTGYLNQNREQKEKIIQEIVKKILTQFPPTKTEKQP